VDERVCSEAHSKTLMADGLPPVEKLARDGFRDLVGASGQAAQDSVLLERTRSEFNSKMISKCARVPDVELWRKAGLPPEVVGVLSYDEKPGIQAISNTAPDVGRRYRDGTRAGSDHEYKRHGTFVAVAGMNG